ncbi:MAG: hypothetical protein LDL07_05545 [Desulfarculus sp.]|nr:hypothetical protein [Desulfarculus sp.]
MKWMEIIALRSLVKANRHLVDELLGQLLQQRQSGLTATIRIYHHPTVHTDLSIHIHWKTEPLNPSGSPLGQQLAYALKGLGLLSHSIWVEAAALE